MRHIDLFFWLGFFLCECGCARRVGEVSLGTEASTSHMLCKYSTTELLPHPLVYICIYGVEFRKHKRVYIVKK